MKALSGTVDAMFADPKRRTALLNQIIHSPPEKTIGLCREMLQSNDGELIIIGVRQLATAERPEHVAAAISALLERTGAEWQTIELTIMQALCEFVIRNRTDNRLPVIGKYFLNKFVGPISDIVSYTAISHFVVVCDRQASCARMLREKLDYERCSTHVVNCALEAVNALASRPATPLEPLVPEIARLHKAEQPLRLRAARVLGAIKSESAMRALERFSA